MFSFSLSFLRTALHIAAADGKLDLVKLLVEKGGASTRVRDRWGATPLLEAAKGKHPDAVDYLVAVVVDEAETEEEQGSEQAGGASKSSKLGISDSDLSGLLCTAVQAKDAEAIALFTRAGANLDAGDYDMRTALHVAAAEGNASVVEALLAAGASPSVRDRWHATPLDEARREGRTEAARVLEAALKRK